jgi:hypothetical protein
MFIGVADRRRLRRSACALRPMWPKRPTPCRGDRERPARSPTNTWPVMAGYPDVKQKASTDVFR